MRMSSQPHGDRVAAEQALVQHLDRRALDEAELQQAALQLGGAQAGRRRAAEVERRDAAAKAHAGIAQCYG